jgi:hypothetical protein
MQTEKFTAKKQGRHIAWGYTSLAIARWFTPGYPLSPLRGYWNSHQTDRESRTLIDP